MVDEVGTHDDVDIESDAHWLALKGANSRVALQAASR